MNFPGEIHATREELDKFMPTKSFNTFEPCLVKASLINYFARTGSDKLPTKVDVSNFTDSFYTFVV